MDGQVADDMTPVESRLLGGRISRQHLVTRGDEATIL
jgi:hypothetical protein